MDFEQTTEVAPDSSAGIGAAPTTDLTSAGTQNTGAPGQVTDARGNVLPAWRVQEIREQAEARAYARAAAEREQWQAQQQAQAAQERQQLIQALQQRAQQPSRSPEEEQQRRQAVAVLHDLAPGLKVFPKFVQSHLELSKTVEQQQQAIQQMQQDQRASFARNEEGRLASFAQQTGLSFKNRADQAQFTDYVAGIIRGNPQALQQFRAGDSNVLPWAFQIAKQHYDSIGQRQMAQLNQTKNRTAGLPPVTRGTLPGAPGRPKMDPDNPDSVRAFEKSLRDGAVAFMASRT